MFQTNHYGLYFNAGAVQHTRENRQRPPFDAAFTTLQTLQPQDPLAAALADGFRYRFLQDQAAANRAAQVLTSGIGFELPPEATVTQASKLTAAAGQAFELVRDLLPEESVALWLTQYRERLQALTATSSDIPPLLDRIWQVTSAITGAVILEDKALFTQGIDQFKHIIGSEIHPEGYLPALVEHSSGGALQRQVEAAEGLVLAAEAAQHAGENLWNVEVRGVSARTAAIYSAAYYEYPDKWPWDEPLSPEATEAFYTNHSGFFEILNRQLRPAILKETIAKLRPIFDPYVGGMTTLSHGVAARRGLFGS